MKSMTGYGYIKGNIGGIKSACEVYTLNHRFQELTLNLPEGLTHYRMKITQVLKRYFPRGSINLKIEFLQGDGALFDVDVNTLLFYKNRIQDILNKHNIDGEIGIETLLTLPGVISEKTGKMIKWDEVKPILMKTVEKANRMREIEGGHIKRDMQKKINTMKEMISSLKKSIGKEEMNITKKVSKKAALFEKMGYDLSREEIMILNGNGGIDEEIVRMGSHLNQFGKFMASHPCGKKLNFIIQEMGRELNTITTKLISPKNIYRAIEMKNLAEKLKEQVQNIE